MISLWAFTLETCRFARWRNWFACQLLALKKLKKMSRAPEIAHGGGAYICMGGGFQKWILQSFGHGSQNSGTNGPIGTQRKRPHALGTSTHKEPGILSKNGLFWLCVSEFHLGLVRLTVWENRPADPGKRRSYLRAPHTEGLS